MFTLDIPYVPAQDAPMVLAQAAVNSGTGSSTRQPDYLLKVCQETESTGDPTSAVLGIDPAYKLKNYIQNRDRRDVDLASIKTTLLEGTKHGKIFAEVDNEGLTAYRYDPEPEYQGKDSAAFMAEFEGKIYKVMIDIVVVLAVDQNASQCPNPIPQFIKIKSKPASGTSGYNLNSVSVSIA
jgi:hypothetical protein